MYNLFASGQVVAIDTELVTRALVDDRAVDLRAVDRDLCEARCFR